MDNSTAVMLLLYFLYVFFLRENEGDSTAKATALFASIDQLKAVFGTKKGNEGRAGGCGCSVPVIALL